MENNILGRIKKLIEIKKITVAELERETGIGNGVIRQWNKSSPTAEKLKKVAQVLGVTIDYLVNGKEIKSERAKKIAELAVRLDDEQAEVVCSLIKEFIKIKNRNIFQLEGKAREFVIANLNYETIIKQHFQNSFSNDLQQWNIYISVPSKSLERKDSPIKIESVVLTDMYYNDKYEMHVGIDNNISVPFEEISISPLSDDMIPEIYSSELEPLPVSTVNAPDSKPKTSTSILRKLIEDTEKVFEFFERNCIFVTTEFKPEGIDVRLTGEHSMPGKYIVLEFRTVSTQQPCLELVRHLKTATEEIMQEQLEVSEIIPALRKKLVIGNSRNSFFRIKENDLL